MTREIKFRAWDIKEKKMWPISSVHSNGSVHVDIPRQVNATMLTKDEHVLMQFTGLHDKNGSPIYEGDIIQSHGYNNKQIVEYCDLQASDDMTAPGIGFQFHSEPSGMEIIGNIYQNPELIK